MTAGASPPRASRLGNRRLGLVIGAVVAIAAVVAGGLLATGILPFGSKPVGLVVSPSGVLLPSIGATRTLVAETIDTAGKRTPATSTWTSSKPDLVSVDAAGVITARANGSAQVTATSGTFTAPPVLVVVTTPAAGVTLVDDAQVVGDPVETNPDAQPSASITYRVTLKGLSPKVGDRLYGTGERPVVGEVTEASTSGEMTTVTLRLVPLPELLPDLDIDEHIDLTNAPVDIVPEVARLYDVVREGTKFTFTPKANFAELAKQSPTSSRSGGYVGPGIAAAGWDLGPGDARAAPAVGTPVGTAAVPLPFTKCELESGAVSNEGPRLLPFSLSDGPSFSVDVDPFLEVVWNDDEQRFVVGASPKVTITLGLKVDLAFKATYTCEVELITFRVPASGPLSFFVVGLVPVGVGFELGGEVTLASAQLSATTEVTGTLGLGFACAQGQGCTIVGELDGSVTKPPQTTVKLVPTAADLRFKPSLELFGFAKAAIGNPILKSLKLEAVEAKVGPKLELDWAPRSVQIADTNYASEFKVTFELAAEAAADLEGVADRLGLGDILAVGVEKSIDLEGSPKGTLDLSKTALTAGQPATARVTLTENVSLLAIYNVAKVVLVRSSGGTETVLATTTATDGQLDFDLPFTPTEGMKAGELHAFVVTKFPPGDVIDFELARSGAAGRLAFFRRDLTLGTFGVYTSDPDGQNVARVADLLGSFGSVVWSPDGSRLVFHDSGGVGFHLFTINGDGASRRQLDLGNGSDTFASWSPDGERLVFSSVRPKAGDTVQFAHIYTANLDGSNLRPITTGAASDYFADWSPDGATIVFARVPERGSYRLFVVSAEGGEARALLPQSTVNDLHPVWSPDGTKIAFQRTVANQDSRIWVMNADGSDAHQLSSGPFDVGPSWSPDGSRIVFSRRDSAQAITFHLFVIGIDGANEGQLSTPVEGAFPNWGP
jgi:hypothetical protein